MMAKPPSNDASLGSLTTVERAKAASSRLAGAGDSNSAIQKRIVKIEALIEAAQQGDPALFKKLIVGGAPPAGFLTSVDGTTRSPYKAACLAPAGGEAMLRLLGELDVYWKQTTRLAASPDEEPLQLALEAGRFENAAAIARIATEKQPPMRAFSEETLRRLNDTPWEPDRLPAQAMEWLAIGAGNQAEDDARNPSSTIKPADFTRAIHIDYLFNHFSALGKEKLRLSALPHVAFWATPHDRILQRVLDLGADANSVEPFCYGRSVPWIATLQQVWPEQPPVGRSALHRACESADVGCVELLLTAGANPNVRDAYQRSPLFYIDTLLFYHNAGEPEAGPFKDRLIKIANALLQAGAEPGDLPLLSDENRALIRVPEPRTPKPAEPTLAETHAQAPAQTPAEPSADQAQPLAIKRRILANRLASPQPSADRSASAPGGS